MIVRHSGGIMCVLRTRADSRGINTYSTIREYHEDYKSQGQPTQPYHIDPRDAYHRSSAKLHASVHCSHLIRQRSAPSLGELGGNETHWWSVNSGNTMSVAPHNEA